MFSAINELFCFTALVETIIVLYFSLSEDESKLPPWFLGLVRHYETIAKAAFKAPVPKGGDGANVEDLERTHSRNFQSRRSLATELTRALNAQRTAREPAPVSPGGEGNQSRPIRRDATGHLYTMRALDAHDHAKLLYYEQVHTLTAVAYMHRLPSTCIGACTCVHHVLVQVDSVSPW